METTDYEQQPNFDRNSAIFVLSTIDKMSLHQIATNFNLPIDEVKNILALHKKYLLLIGE